jgi:hypothetical protein
MSKVVANYINQILVKYDLSKRELKEMTILLKEFVGMGMNEKEIQQILTDYNIHL